MFYGMSVFMLPLEKEFGWTRAQTSWVTTIGLALIAVWYVVRRLHPGSPRARPVAVDRRPAVQPRVLPRQLHAVADDVLSHRGCHRGTGSGFGYVVPTSVGSKWFPDKRGLVIGLMVGGYGAGSGVFGPIALVADRQRRLAQHVSDSRARVSS
jgi:OFA family oxalate/formate antiporter-like MFS transporter